MDKETVRNLIAAECEQDQAFYKDPLQMPYPSEDVVNHPSHYETGKFECFDVMREIYGDDFMKHFCIGNAFKYMYRFPRKNGVEDVRKAKRYLEIFLEIVDEEERNV